MSSWKSIKLLLFMEGIASRLLLTPISWDTHNQKFIQLKKNPNARRYYWIRQPWGIGILILHFLFISYMFYYLKLARVTQVAGWIPFMFLTAAYMLGMSIHVNYLRRGNEVPELYNSYIYMSKNAPFNRGKTQQDGRIEVTMQLLFAGACLTLVAGVPGLFYCIHTKVVGFSHFSSDYLLLNILFTIISGTLAVVDWVVTISVVYVIIIHTTGISAMQLYMIKKWSNPHGALTIKTKWRLHVFYRIQQIQHAVGMRIAGPLLPFIIPLDEGVIIIGVFGILRYYKDLHPLISLTALSTNMFGLVTLKLALQLAERTSANSIVQREAYKRQPSLQNILDKRRFRSYKPLEWIIGNSFKIHRDTFPKILQNVIMDTVVNLLVFSRSTG